LPELRTFESRLRELLPAVAGTAAASLTIIGVLIMVYRLRASQEETGKGSRFGQHVKFEKEVAKALSGAGDLIRPAGGHDAGYDFLLSTGSRKILVEVRWWRIPVPVQVWKRLFDRIRATAQRVGANEAIVVTPTSVRLPDGALETTMVKLMTLRELRAYLAHLPTV